jgi:hypothetical protein
MAPAAVRVCLITRRINLNEGKGEGFAIFYAVRSGPLPSHVPLPLIFLAVTPVEARPFDASSRLPRLLVED